MLVRFQVIAPAKHDHSYETTNRVREAEEECAVWP